MKKSKIMFFLGAFVAGFAIQSFSQEVLPEVTLVAVRYKYLIAVGGKDVAQPVKVLERKAATYDIKSADFYEDEYDDYSVQLYIPQGKILAAYDKNGKLLRTAEKYENVAIPAAVRQSVANRFPGWTISKDVYLVNYHETKGVTKVYKLLLENGDKRSKVKTNEIGDFID